MTEPALGKRLRRASRRADARGHLRTALACFEQLGAEPWAEQARAELRSTGERVRTRAHTRTDELTPQELQVALVAGARRDEQGGGRSALPVAEDDREAPRAYSLRYLQPVRDSAVPATPPEQNRYERSLQALSPAFVVVPPASH